MLKKGSILKPDAKFNQNNQLSKSVNMINSSKLEATLNFKNNFVPQINIEQNNM